VNNTKVRIPTGSLQELIATKPEMFSPNVILRPVYQELMLPDLAFIGGAGEISYWLELKAVFEHHGVNYPMLVMRSSMTIINSSIEKKMAKLSLSAVDFFKNPDQTINCFVKSKLSSDIQFDEEKKSLAALFDSFVLKAEKVDPTLRAAVMAEKQKQQQSLEAIEGKIIKAEKRKQEEAINQIRSIYQTFTPAQSWQERIENFIPFYLKDNEFVKHSVEAADPFKKSMLVINLDI
jgi:uncharacterized protein YllA (UPF0747 family)